MSEIYKAPEAELVKPIPVGEYGSLETAMSGDYSFDPVELYKKAWENLMGLKATLWIALIVYAVIAGVLGAITAFVFGSNDPLSFGFGDLIGQILSTFLLSPLYAGLFMITLKHSIGSPIQVGELFKHYDKILPIFLVVFLTQLLVMIGLVLLFIPGIYLAVAFSFALPLVVEKNMSPIEALKVSRKVVHHKWFSFAGFLLLGLLIVIVGAIALLVGLVWAIPLVAFAWAMAYRDIFGIDTANQ